MSDSQTPTWVYLFAEGRSEGDPACADVLGGKGASLAAMSRAGFPVPPGFTISSACCAFVEEKGRWPPGLEDQVRRAMSRLEGLAGRTFGRGPAPLLVAVRSGAAVSMPGMMDTVLNVGRPPSPDGPEPWDHLFESINAVFASWNSARAAAYRRRNDVRGVGGTAVNVQAMFPSERAGVLFTANPNDVAAGEMVIEASWGLGESVVSGAVTPDVYVLDAQSLAVRRQTAGERPAADAAPALTPEQIRELAQLGRRVEAHFGFPCDIEWGLAAGAFTLFQCRPIRGLDVLREAEAARGEAIEQLRAAAGAGRVVWVAHNLGETLPAPTPLTWDIVRRFMSGSGGFGLMYRDLGYRPSSEVCADGFLDLICGRIYVDPRRAAGLFWDGVPLEYDAEEVLHDPSVLGRAPAKLDMAKADPLFFLRVPRLVWSLFRGAGKLKRARANAVEAFERRALPRLASFLEAASARDLAALATGELLAELDRRRRFALDDFGKEALKPGFFAGMAQQGLVAILTQLLGEEAGPDLARVLTAGLDHDSTVEQNVLLFRVAQGEATLEEFLAEHGHRAVNEMELAQPRWREEPSYLERMVESFRGSDVASPADRHARQAAARERAEAELPARLAEAGGASLLERILPQLHEAQRLLPYRETAKHHLMKGYETIRAVLIELARRWDLGRDLFFLRFDELERFEAERDALEEALAARKLRWRAAQRLALADAIDSDALDDLGRPAPPDEGAALQGRPLASGFAEGIARVVLDPHEARDLGTGYILVCPSTDPGWTPLFVHATGLVVERGGALSHGAIVARDFGIPAVACENATRAIPDGASIAVDGSRGTVSLTGVPAVSSSTSISSSIPFFRGSVRQPKIEDEIEIEDD